MKTRPTSIHAKGDWRRYSSWRLAIGRIHSSRRTRIGVVLFLLAFSFPGAAAFAQLTNGVFSTEGLGDSPYIAVPGNQGRLIVVVQDIGGFYDDSGGSESLSSSSLALYDNIGSSPFFGGTDGTNIYYQDALFTGYGGVTAAFTPTTAAGNYYFLIYWPPSELAFPPGNLYITNWQIKATYNPTVTALAGGGGTISPAGLIQANYNGSQVFTASPSNNYAVNQWLVGTGVVQMGGSAYTLSAIQTNQTVQVTFTYTNLDIGLRAYDGTAIVALACERASLTNSPLRISKNGTNYAILLTATNSSNASKFRVRTSAGTKSLMKLP